MVKASDSKSDGATRTSSNPVAVDLFDFLVCLFTFSIDTVNDKQLNTLLIDDAFSIVENKDNTYLLYLKPLYH